MFVCFKRVDVSKLALTGLVYELPSCRCIASRTTYLPVWSLMTFVNSLQEGDCWKLGGLRTASREVKRRLGRARETRERYRLGASQSVPCGPQALACGPQPVHSGFSIYKGLKGRFLLAGFLSVHSLQKVSVSLFQTESRLGI